MFMSAMKAAPTGAPQPKNRAHRRRRARTSAASPASGNAEPLRADQLVLHLKQRAHRAAVLSELSNVVVNRFAPRAGGAPDFSVRGRSGTEPADLCVVLEIAAQLQARAEEEERMIAALMKKPLAELRASDCPILKDDDDEQQEDRPPSFDQLLVGGTRTGDGG